MISFTIPIEPKSLQFSGKRLCTVKGRPFFFKTAQAKSWETEVRLLCAPYIPREPFSGPVSLSLVFVFSRPMYMTEKKFGAARIWHTKKPDRTNLVKAWEDCLADFWENDSQVCSGEVKKFYGAAGEKGCVEVRISDA